MGGRRVFRRRLRAARAAAALLSAALAPAGAASALTIQPPPTDLPSASEAARQAEYPIENGELGLFDVFLAERAVGTFLVEFDGERFRFEDPDGLLAELPEEADRDAVRTTLRATLARNTSQICPERRVREDCGVLSPDSVAGILNARSFRIDLFLNPAFLPQAEAAQTRYIAPIGGAASAIASVRLQLSQTQGEGMSYLLATNASVAAGPGYLDLSALADREGASLNRARYIVDFERSKLSAGLVNFRPLPGIGSLGAIGVQWRRSYDRVADRSLLLSEPIYLFLARRSRVEVYRGDRLLSAGDYPAGNISIDTSDLPAGNYVVQLRILDPVSGERQESRFISNASAIGPVGGTDFTFELGLARDAGPEADPDAPYQTVVARAGLAKRWTANFASGVDIAATTDSAILSSSVQFYLPNLTADISAFIGEAGQNGAELRTTTSIAGLRLTGSARIARGEPSASGFSLTPPPSSSYSLSVARNFGHVSTGVRGTAFELNGRTEWTLNPYLNYPLGRLGGAHFVLAANGQLADGEHAFFLRLSTSRASPTGSRSASASWRQVRRDGETLSAGEFQGRVTRRREHNDRELELEGGVYLGADYQSLDGQADWEGPAGRASASAVYTLGETESRYRVGLNASSTIAFGAGRVVVLGNQRERSAALVSVSGGPPDGEYEIAVNRGQRISLPSGGARVVPLSPYAEHEMELRPVNGTVAATAEARRSAAFYPGVFTHYHWEVQRQVLFVTRIVAAGGEPLARARSRGGGAFGLTDENGYLQIEAAPGVQMEFETRDGARCLVDLPGEDALDENRDIAVIEFLECR